MNRYKQARAVLHDQPVTSQMFASSNQETLKTTQHDATDEILLLWASGLGMALFVTVSTKNNFGKKLNPEEKKVTGEELPGSWLDHC